MSTHKYIDRICCAVVALTLLLAVIFVNAGKLGVVPAMAQAGYASGLFDASKVHTINIEMEDWEGFLETCENEEYSACSVTVDGEAFKNVGIRAKGNTSLSSVAAYGNDRYSFKIEFDCYESGNTYHGLDKISLNNIIQDNTYMKDFLVYQMMGDFGVASPLCSYAYITVNGEDWGLYLAVEAVEESFLARNYGNNYGNLYKPDSMDMGGGRGNGGDFDMERMKERIAGENGESPDGETIRRDASGEKNNQRGFGMSGDGEMPQMPENGGLPQMPEDGEAPQMPEDGRLPQMPEDGEMPQMPENGRLPQMPEDGEAPQMPEDGRLPQAPEEGQMHESGNAQNFGGRGGGPGKMGSDDVALVYSDDDYDSYSNIFDNAKTEISKADKDRLISSLKKLGQGEDMEDTVDVEAVIRYFVVHNFVCNFDSYTGSLMHNYYLYEKEGKLSMIPWDYNLAFGGFEDRTGAEAMINYPIDSPVSGDSLSSRPMIAWIFDSEEYTEMYHQYFEEFLDSYFASGYFEEMITSVKEMIAPYVEKDPTKFCTYEAFEKGVDTLKEFCLLRAESVSGQLAGVIPSTTEGQAAESDGLVDASGISLSDMGSMGHGGMGGGRGFQEKEFPGN